MKPTRAEASHPATVKPRFNHLVILAVLLLAWVVNAAEPADPESTDPRRAVVAMLEGTGDYTVGGVTKSVELGTVLPEGAVLRSTKGSEIVIFFRQIGTMVRLRPETTVVLETMRKFVKDDVLLKETVLDLKSGQIMFVVRVLDARSKFEVKLPGYVAAFDGAGTGRFDVNAKGTVYVGRKSERSLRVTTVPKSGEGILVSPGFLFSRVDSKVVPVSDKIVDELRPDLDKLESLAKALTPPPRAEELSRDKRK